MGFDKWSGAIAVEGLGARGDEKRLADEHGQ